MRDSLTGLFNRRHLDATIARLEASRARRAPADRDPAAAIIFDLDHFGAINKRHGHQTGDAILRAFADILRARFRGTDLVARYGGEEFLAILDGRPSSRPPPSPTRSGSPSPTSGPGPDGSPIRATVSAGCAAMAPTRTLRRHRRPRRRRAGDRQAGGTQPGHRRLTGSSAGHAPAARRPGRGRCRTAPRTFPAPADPAGTALARGMLAARQPARSPHGMTIDRRASTATQLALRSTALPPRSRTTGRALPSARRVCPRSTSRPSGRTSSGCGAPPSTRCARTSRASRRPSPTRSSARYSRRGDVVLDPFSGRGTTPLQACAEGRIGVGNDLNPFAHLLTAAKVEPADPGRDGDPARGAPARLGRPARGLAALATRSVARPADGALVPRRAGGGGTPRRARSARRSPSRSTRGRSPSSCTSGPRSASTTGPTASWPRR